MHTLLDQLKRFSFVIFAIGTAVAIFAAYARVYIGCGYQWPELALWLYEHQISSLLLWIIVPLIAIAAVITTIMAIPRPRFLAGFALFVITVSIFGILSTHIGLYGFRGCFSKTAIMADFNLILNVEEYYFSKFGSYTDSLERLASRTNTDLGRFNKRGHFLYSIDLSEPGTELDNIEFKALYGDKVFLRCRPEKIMDGFTTLRCSSPISPGD